MSYKTVLAWGIVLAAAGGAYFVQKTYGRPAMDMAMAVRGGADAKVPVAVARAELMPLAATATYTGTVAAYAEEDIYPRVTGRILEMRVYPGDRVESGQIVARLDDVELGSKVREATAAVGAAEANLAQMEADAVAARHGVLQMEKELAMVEAESGYQQSVAARDERLLAKGAIAQQEADNSRAMAAAARAKVEAARAKLEQARAMEASARKKREAMTAMAAQSQAMLRTTEVVRDYVNIRAASKGYVAKRLIGPGTLVQPGMTILKIAQLDRVRFQANVADRDVARLRAGSPVRVRMAGGERPPLNLKVTSIFPFAEGSSRTAVVEAVAENPGRRFLPGQYVVMEFDLGDRVPLVTVPRGAVQRLGEQAYVWTVGSDTATRRSVKTGPADADRVGILGGLQAGETVIVSGHENLYQGAKVAAEGLPVAGAGGTPETKGMPEMKGMPETKGMPDIKAAPAPQPAGDAGKAKIELATKPKPPVVGKNTFVITVRDPAGKPISDAAVKVTYGMPPMRGMASGMTLDDEAKHRTNGVYEAAVQLGMAGPWKVTVSATRGNETLGTASFDFQVK